LGNARAGENVTTVEVNFARALVTAAQTFLSECERLAPAPEAAADAA
jgi:hypothetical protein